MEKSQEANEMKQEIRDYFADWEGWSCTVEVDGQTCGEVIEATTKELQNHLREQHGIVVELG